MEPNSARDGSDIIGASLIAARNGSDSALGQLLDHYRDYLLRVAHDELASDLAPKMAPSDLVQETFLKAARAFPKFEGVTEPELRIWLRKILINCLRDTNRQHHTRQKRAVSLEVSLDDPGAATALLGGLQCPSPSPSDCALSAEQQSIVRRAIAALPEDYRRVIELRNIESRSFDEIGPLLGRSPEAVRKLWSRAVQRLSRELSA